MTDVSDFVNDNFRDLVLLGGVVVGYFAFTDAEAPALPDLPNASPLLATAAVLAGLAGLLVGSMVWGLVPDPPKVYLACIRAQDANGLEIWELSPDKFEDVTVEDGTLNELSECKSRAYECLDYDPESNTARATWRMSAPSSEIIGESMVGDALDQIAEMRESMEEEARRGKHIRRRIGSMVRRLDRQRAMDQAAALEGHVAPSIDGEATIDEVVREELGDLAPEHISADDERATDSEPEGPAIEFVGDGDALDPVEPNGGPDDE